MKTPLILAQLLPRLAYCKAALRHIWSSAEFRASRLAPVGQPDPPTVGLDPIKERQSRSLDFG